MAWLPSLCFLFLFLNIVLTLFIYNIIEEINTKRKEVRK